MVAALPAAAVGAVVHVVPYQIMKKLGALPRNESIKATVKLLGCAVLFAVVYVAIGVVMGEGPVGRTGRRHCGARLRLRRRAVGRAGENGSGAWWPGRGFCGSDEPCWGRC